MAITITWDSTFEAQPTSALSRSLIDDEIRRTKLAIRQRMEVEHEFGGDSSLDDGSHIAGGTTVMDKGNDAGKPASPQTGALYLNTQSGRDVLEWYDGIGWETIGVTSHLDLTGTADADHPTLVAEDGGVMTGNMNLGGNKLITNAGAGVYVFGDFLLRRHETVEHPSLGSVAALADEAIGANALKTATYSVEVVIPALSVYTVEPPVADAFYFVPQVVCKEAATSAIQLCGAATTTGLFGIRNDTLAGATTRIRLEYWY